MTKQELQKAIAKKLISRYSTEATVLDLTTGMNSLNNGRQKQLMKMVKQGNASKVLETLQDILKQSAITKAESKAQTMLADDSLSLAELEKIL